MEIINSITGFIAKIIQWWFTVMPWEQAIFVRKGNKVRVLGPGFYFKIPFIDAVYIQTTRMRMIDIPMQTMSSRDGVAVTIKSCIGYSISDIFTLYKNLYHPEMTLSSMVMGEIGQMIRASDVSEISPGRIERLINDRIASSDFGIKDVTVRITTFAIVKTFRIMQDGSGLYENLIMEAKK